MVEASGFEPEASCAQGSCRKSILLVRLALFYVMVHGFGPNLAVVGPKLDPTFGMILTLNHQHPSHQPSTVRLAPLDYMVVRRGFSGLVPIAVQLVALERCRTLP